MPPYRRKGYKRSYGRSRSTSRRRRAMGGSFMKRAKTRAYANLRTGGLLAIERKFSDFAMPLTALSRGGAGVNSGLSSTFAPGLALPTVYRSAVGVITNPVAPSALNVLGPGDTGSDRDGRQVINDSIHIRGILECIAGDVGTANGSTVVNIVLVLDTQTNGAVPSGGAVFVNPGDLSGASPGDNGACPFVNLANSKRFRILKHIRRSVCPQTMSITGGANYAQGNFPFSMDIPLKQMKTNYVADTAVTSATVASIGDNGLFLFAWSDTTAYAALAYNSRLRFRG